MIRSGVLVRETVASVVPVIDEGLIPVLSSSVDRKVPRWMA